MFSSNTETGITATYQDDDGTIDFVVSDTTVAGDSGSTGMTPGDTLTIAGGTNVTTAMSGDTLTITSTDTNTQLSTEQVQDIVGAMFSSNTETGITATYEDGDGTIDLVVGTLNQDTTGTATIATNVTVADESSDTSCNVLFTTAATGNLPPKSGDNLTFNSSSGMLTATGFTGVLIGNADTATAVPDNSITLAKMAGLARGKIIYGDASDNPSALAAGSNAQVLTSDGTDISWQNAGGGDGDIEGVTAGTGLSGGGTSGTVSLAVDFSELTDMTGDISGSTEFILQNSNTESRKAASEIKLSNFNNDLLIATEPHHILECFSGKCDGSTITTQSGNQFTFQNCTGLQNMPSVTTSVTGSSVTYEPPSGTLYVEYEYSFTHSRSDVHSIIHVDAVIDGTVVTKNSRTFSNYQGVTQCQFQMIIEIGTNNISNGQVSSWNSTRVIYLRAREYGSSWEAILNTNYWWNGTYPASGDQQFVRPVVKITAYGTKSI